MRDLARGCGRANEDWGAGAAVLGASGARSDETEPGSLGARVLAGDERDNGRRRARNARGGSETRGDRAGDRTEGSGAVGARVRRRSVRVSLVLAVRQALETGAI